MHVRWLVTVATVALSVALGSSPAYAQQKMYWATSGSIWRANLDGSNVEEIVVGSLGNGPAIALDVRGGRLYWTESSSHLIRGNVYSI